MHSLLTHKRTVIIGPMVTCCVSILLELLASFVLHCTEKGGWKPRNEARVVLFPGSLTLPSTLQGAWEQG